MQKIIPSLKIYQNSEPSLEEAQKHVGGYVEGLELDNGDYMIFDEEGLLKNKTLNTVASEFVRMYGRHPHQIVGEAILIKAHARKDWA